VSSGIDMRFYCKSCGLEIFPTKAMLRRGRGRTCSLSCAASLSAKNRNQSGENNPNWKSGCDSYRNSKRRYRARHPEKSRAHMIVRSALQSGDMIRLPCEVCGIAPAEGHHNDYNMPLKVTWLCKKHHEKHHVEMRSLGIEKYHTASVARGLLSQG